MPEPQQQDDQSAQIFAVLRAKRDKLKKLPPEMQALGLGAVFDEFVKPRLRTSGVSDKDMAVARQNFAKHMLGEGGQLPESFGQPPKEEADVKTKASALYIGGLGKASGIVKNLADWDLMAAKVIGGDREARRDSFMKRLRDLAASRESEWYGMSHEASPGAAKTGAYATDLAMTSGPFVGASKLVPSAAKGASLGAKVLSGAGKGALGTAASTAMVTTDPKQIAETSAYGAGLGAVFGALGKLFDRRAKTAATQMKPPAAAPAPTKFKSWMSMTPEEQRAYAKISPAAQPKAAKISTKPATAVAPKPQADTKEAAQWRQRQYVKLSKAGIRPVGEIKDRVKQGMTAEQILGERSGASPPKAEAVLTPAAKVGTPDLHSRTVKIMKERGVGYGEASRVADVAIAQAEGPQAAAAVKGVTKVAEGVSGVPPGDKKLLDGLDEARQRFADAKSPLARAKIQKSIDNIKAALGGDKEAVAKIKHAEGEAAARASASAEAPQASVAFEGPTPVPATQQGLTNTDLIDTLKTINVPGKDIKLVASSFEKYRKSGKLSDEDMRAGLEKTYQTIGQWMGIEGAEEMSLEELYARIAGR